MAGDEDALAKVKPGDARLRRTGPMFVLMMSITLGLLTSALVIPITRDSTQVEAGAGGPASATDAAGRSAGDAGAGEQRVADEGTTPAGRGAVEGGAGDGAGGDTGPEQPGSDPGAGPVEGADGSAPGAPDVRGVTADNIKIGVAIPSTGALGEFSDTFDIGDVEEQMAAILDGWVRTGEVPVHGRNVEFIYRTYDIFSGDEQIAVCNGFVKDDKVFAVIGIRFFSSGAQCVAGEHDTPLVTLDGAPDSVYERAAPFYVSIRYSMTTMVRNWAHWAHEAGLLEGRTIGVYYESEREGEVDGALVPELARLGYEVEEKVDAGSGQGFGGTSRDSISVQQFRSAGVDTLLPLIGSTQFASFMQQAESQGYRPQYLDTDFGDHTSDAGASIFPASQYDGTYAITGKRVGELAAGMRLHPRTEACLSNYERYSGRQLRREPPESGEFDTILAGCDDAEVVLRGLQHTGPQLTPTSFIGGIEAIQGHALAGHGGVSYSPRHHHGVVEFRTARWHADCGCWRAEGAFRPLAVR